MKEKLSLDLFDLSEYPKGMKVYLKNFGFHFSKKAAKEAIKGLRRINAATDKLEPVEMKDKEEVESILTKYGVKLENDCLYDAVWVYHMLMSDLWKSGIEDEAHLAKSVKAIIDDPDQRDGFIFNRWVSDRLFNGNPIDWDGIL